MKATRFSWWRQLAPRERQLISWGGGALLVALSYAYLWLPVSVERHKLRANLPLLRESAAQMQRQADEAVQLSASVAPLPGGKALQSAIQQAANAAGIDGKRLQVNLLDEGRANIALAAVPFDAWTALVENMQRNHGVRLESCTVEALPESGMSSVRAVVTAGR